MKRSVVYRKAAVHLERGRCLGNLFGKCGGCCDAIAHIGMGDARHFTTYSACSDFSDLFKPEDSIHAYWGSEWEPEEDRCRILALCFMAAIAEYEERNA